MRVDARVLVAQRSRLLLDWAIFAPAATVALYTATGINDVGRVGRVATCAVVLAILPSLLGALLRPARLFVPSFAAAVLLATFALRSLGDVASGGLATAAFGLREAAYLAIWVSGLWVVRAAVAGPASLDAAERRLGILGLAVAGSVWLAVVGHRLGFSLGEALDFRDGSVRLFGILGDNASHLLAFFVLYEGLRRRWLRFAFVLGPLLFGLPRGALVVLLAGVAWLLAGAVVRAVGRASLGALARALGAALIALGAAAALLLLTPLGPALAQRFDTPRRDIGLLGDRQASFQRAWQTFHEHPIAGVGLGGYLQQVEDSGLAHDPRGTRRRDEPMDARRWTPEMGSAQNQLLQIAAESGSIGLLAYALFCTAALRTVLAATRRRRGPLLAAACAYVVAVLLGLQTAVWLLDKSTVGALVFTLLGIAERGERLSANATLPSALAASPAP